MPVKLRKPKRRALSPEQDAIAWAFMFQFGQDYFSDLAEIGIARDRVPNLVRAAWKRLGRCFLSLEPKLSRDEPWALKRFGSPE